MKDSLKKKIKQAIALEYNPAEDAPKVIASGQGALAERIIEKAKESSVPVHRDDSLADTLSRLETNQALYVLLPLTPPLYAPYRPFMK